MSLDQKGENRKKVKEWYRTVKFPQAGGSLRCPSKDRKNASRGLDLGALLPPNSEILGSKLSLHLSFSFCKILLFTQRVKNVATVEEVFLLKERINHHHLGGRNGDCSLPDRV